MPYVYKQYVYMPYAYMLYARGSFPSALRVRYRKFCP